MISYFPGCTFAHVAKIWSVIAWWGHQASLCIKKFKRKFTRLLYFFEGISLLHAWTSTYTWHTCRCQFERETVTRQCSYQERWKQILLSLRKKGVTPKYLLHTLRGRASWQQVGMFQWRKPETVEQNLLLAPVHTETSSCVFVLFTFLKGIENNQLITWNNTKTQENVSVYTWP